MQDRSRQLDENLLQRTAGPYIGLNSDIEPRPSQVRSTLNSGNRQTARACPHRIVSLGRVISNLVWHQQAQRCIVSNALLAKEGHCIDLGTGIVVGAKKSDVLDAGRHRSPGRGMFLTGYFTLPISGGAFIASRVIDVGVAAMQLTVAQYQDATNVLGHTIAGTSIQRIEPVPNHDCFHTRSPTNIADASKIVP